MTFHHFPTCFCSSCRDSDGNQHPVVAGPDPTIGDLICSIIDEWNADPDAFEQKYSSDPAIPSALPPELPGKYATPARKYATPAPSVSPAADTPVTPTD